MGRARAFDEQDILERATRLFWRQGFNGTSMHDLVEATGLAKASIYNAYGNKNELFQAVLAYYIDTKQSQGFAVLDSDETSGREALLTYYDNLIQIALANQQTPGCLLANTATELSLHDQAIRDIVERGFLRTETHFVKTIERGIKDGSIDPDTDAQTAASCLVAMQLGLRVMTRNGVNAEKMRTIIHRNIDLHLPPISETVN